MSVSGAFPMELDYEYCFANGIWILSAAPAFGRQVAEMALGMAIACGRGIVEGHLAMQKGEEKYLHAGRFRAAIDVFPQKPLDPAHPIRSAPNVVLSAHRADSVREALWEIGEMVLDDLEAIGKGVPPQRMQRAEPELAPRYASTRVKGHKSN